MVNLKIPHLGVKQFINLQIIYSLIVITARSITITEHLLVLIFEMIREIIDKLSVAPLRNAG